MLHLQQPSSISPPYGVITLFKFRQIVLQNLTFSKLTCYISSISLGKSGTLRYNGETLRGIGCAFDSSELVAFVTRDLSDVQKQQAICPCNYNSNRIVKYNLMI